MKLIGLGRVTRTPKVVEGLNWNQKVFTSTLRTQKEDI